MARVWFIAKVTGHYDDLGIMWHAPDTDSYIKVDWVKYDVEQGHTFLTWADGGVVNCSYEYPYVLRLGIDEYGVDSFPQEEAVAHWLTGTAAAGQTLRWMYGAPYDLYTVDQAALYTAHHTGEPEHDMNTADVRMLMQTEKPVTTPSYAYNFVAEADDDEDMAVKRFIHWCDFNVQTYFPSGTGIQEPQVPSLIVTGDGTYGYQWKTLRGFATRVDPCDESSVFTIPDMEVHGLWLNDPAINGLGYNVYLTGDEFKATYEPVDGKYRSVCEPPDNIDEALLETSLRAARIQYRKGKPHTGVQDALDATKASSAVDDVRRNDASLAGDSTAIHLKEVFKEIDWDEVIPTLLLTSPDFMNIYSKTHFTGTMTVADLDAAEEYELVLFSRSGAANSASVVLMIEEESGAFRQATWTSEDQSYLSAKRALEIARKAVCCSSETAKGTGNMATKWTSRLVWGKKHNQSRFQPIYEITAPSGQRVYVLQDGSFFLERPKLEPLDIQAFVKPTR
jgi:hypothetical protein